MKNFLLGLSKFVLGIILAMFIMGLAGASMLRYFMARNAEDPDRPFYENDLPEEQRPIAESPDVAAEEPVSEAAPDPEPEPEPAPSGSYRVVVTQPVGLILRSGPGTDYENIGGIDFDERVTVLGEEAGWLNVTLSNGQEGWIKDGNTSRE